MNTTPLLAAIAALACAAPAGAQDAPNSELDEAIVIVAARAPTSASRLTAAVSTLDRGDIERRQATRVDDVLRDVPGVLVVRDGPAGQTSRVYLRGAASTQTLFVIDGIPQNDATTGGGFDLNDLGTAAVERIEVLRGSYGVLYGSEAIGGVVSVTTRRGGGDPAGFVRIEGGAFDTLRQSAGAYGGNPEWAFALTGANERTHGERRRESHTTSDVTGRVTYSGVRGVRVDWTGRLADSTTESPFDFGFGTVLPEDVNIERTRQTLSTGLSLEWRAADWIDVRAHVSYLGLDSTFENGPDGVDVIDPDFVPGSGDEVRVVRDEFVSRSDQDDVRGRFATTVRLGDLLGWRSREDGGMEVTFTTGAEVVTQESRGRTTSPDFGAPTSTTLVQDDTTRTKSLFALAEVAFADAGVLAQPVVTVGVRRDDHNASGAESSPHVGARVGFEPTGTLVRASYGEGFRAPKPSELFDPFVGNATLTAETSKSFDAGVRQELFDGALAMEATWFELEVEDLIAFDATATSASRPFGALRNFRRTRTRGTEWAAQWVAGHGFTVRGAYTRQRPLDLDTGLDLPNRSRSFGTLGVTWEDGPLEVGVHAYYAARNHDQGGEFVYPEPGERRNPGRARLVDATVRYRASSALTVFARVENLLDDDHVSTPSAPAGPPLAAYAGLQWDF